MLAGEVLIAGRVDAHPVIVPALELHGEHTGALVTPLRLLALGTRGNSGPPPVHDMPPPMSWSNVTVISVTSGSTSFAPTAGEVAIILGGACALLPDRKSTRL